MAADQSHWVGGFHAVEARLKAAELEKIELDRARHDRRARQLVEQAKRYQVPVRLVSGDHLDARHPEIKHQGVSALLKSDSAQLGQTWQDCVAGQDQPLILVLDEVEDPRNLGACLRVADGAGASCVVVPKRRAAGLNDVARKTAAGAAESMPLVVVGNLAQALKAMAAAGFRICGLADAEQGSLYQQDLRGPLVMVLGNEGRGVRQLTAQHCDVLASLPMLGQVSSLNVSVACGVALYEVVRQRQLALESIKH